MLLINPRELGPGACRPLRTLMLIRCKANFELKDRQCYKGKNFSFCKLSPWTLGFNRRQRVESSDSCSDPGHEEIGPDQIDLHSYQRCLDWYVANDKG